MVPLRLPAPSATAIAGEENHSANEMQANMMPNTLASGLLALLLAFPLAAPGIAWGQSSAAPPAPLSPAQIALFATPHLQNIDHPETLLYHFVRQGPDGFADQVGEQIKLIHPDGGKYVMFNFLSGPRHVFYPALDGFHGNPLVMVFLEHDVNEMRDATGIAAAYYRNHIRAAFIDKASVSPVSVTLAGRTIAAREITLRPFTDDDRLTHLPQIRGKTYRFVVSPEVPGGVFEMAAEEAADPASGAPAFIETMTFDKAEATPAIAPAGEAKP